MSTKVFLILSLTCVFKDKTKTLKSCGFVWNIRLKCHWSILILATSLATLGSAWLWTRCILLWVVIFSFLEAIGSYWLYSWCGSCCADLMSFMCVVKRLHCLVSCPCQNQTAQFFMPWFSLSTVGIIFWDANTLYQSLCLCVCV